MENNTTSQTFVSGNNSGVILGTSSDAIVEGLHKGQFTDSAAGSSQSPKDDEQIVNQQDQQEIINPQEKDYVEGESALKQMKRMKMKQMTKTKREAMKNERMHVL
jgi:hypothetical protein